MIAAEYDSRLVCMGVFSESSIALKMTNYA